MHLTIEEQNFILSRKELTEENITPATPTMFMAKIQNAFSEIGAPLGGERGTNHSNAIDEMLWLSFKHCLTGTLL